MFFHVTNERNVLRKVPLIIFLPEKHLNVIFFNFVITYEENVTKNVSKTYPEWEKYITYQANFVTNWSVIRFNKSYTYVHQGATLCTIRADTSKSTGICS